jgi:GNAT superfamily N-acetyltransferase
VTDRLTARFRIEMLAAEHDRTTFRCGVSELDAYIRERAVQDMKRHLANAFVLLEGASPVLGYYTLSQQAISMESVPAEIARKLPKYGMLPATLIGRLAVHADRQGDGLGSLLLMDALRRSWQAAHSVASYAVRVDATDERARNFYLRHDFRAFPVERLKLFLPMADLDRLFETLRTRSHSPKP